jgi:hypothetical protein
MYSYNTISDKIEVSYTTFSTQQQSASMLVTASRVMLLIVPTEKLKSKVFEALRRCLYDNSRI